MHIQKIIEQLGLGEYEARLYLASLSLGEATLSELAKAAKLPRTSCYEAVSGLLKKEFLNFYVKRRRRYYIAENPEKFMLLLRAKEALVKEVLPNLQALRHERHRKPAIRFYEGAEGLRVIFGDVINEKRPVLATTNIEWAERVLAGDFEDFIQQRIKHKLPLRLLTSRSPESLQLKARDAHEFRQTRFLPEGLTFETANWIYGDRVAIISISPTHPLGIVIEDARIANTHRIYFELAWRQAEDA